MFVSFSCCGRVSTARQCGLRSSGRCSAAPPLIPSAPAMPPDAEQAEVVRAFAEQPASIQGASGSQSAE
eukprot:5915931-Lingulodinium_polyedra.AAC.1